MPPLPSPSTWRTHPQNQDVRLFILTPNVVIARAINQVSFSYPVAELTYDNPAGNPGSYTDVKVGQTLAIYDSTGDTLKGLARIRLAPSSTVLYISPISEGDIQFANNDILQVWNEYRMWAKIPRLAPDGTAYKDWDVDFPGAAASQPPVANAGCWVADACPVAGTISVPFDGTGSYAVADGATITTYLWDIDDGSFTSGNSGSSAPTCSFPAGFRWVSLTVTDSNGNTHTARVLVVADDGTYGTRVSVSRLGGTVENGWEGSFALLENDLSGFPNGACVMLWAIERYGNTQGSLNGPTGRQQVKFCGWLVEELDTVEPLLSDVVVNAQSALGFLGHLPAFSMTTEYAPTPSDWTQIANMTMWRQAHYLMQWHSTLLDVCDVLRPSYYADYPYPRLNATEGMIDEQLQFVANAVGARVTCDQRNIVYWRKNPQLMTAAERAAVSTVVTLAETDWSESLPVRVRYEKQVSVVRAIAGVSNQTDVLTIAAVAPGASPGVEGGQEQLPNLLVFSQSDLNERLGRYYAWKNLAIPELPMTVFLQGMVNDPAWQEYAFFTLDADTNRRGLAIENQPYLLNSLDVTFNHEQGTSLEQWGLETLTAETGIASALTQQLPGAEPPDEGSYISSDGFFIDPLITDPYTGPDWYDIPPPDYAYVAPIDYVPNDVSTPSSNAASAYFAWNTVFARTTNPGNVSPSWLEIFPVVNGSVVTAVASEPDNWGWVLTNNSIFYTPDDLRSGTPSWSAQSAVSGAYLARHIPGVSGGTGVGWWSEEEDDDAVDFAATDGGFVALTGSGWQFDSNPLLWTFNGMGAYSPGNGWANNNSQYSNSSPSSGWVRGAAVWLEFATPVTITDLDLLYNYTGVGSTLIRYATEDDDQNWLTNAQSTANGTNITLSSSGDMVGVKRLLFYSFTSLAGSSGALTGSCLLKSFTFTTLDATFSFSPDAGLTVTDTTIGSAGTAGGDVDDFNLGVVISASGGQIVYTTAYTGGFTRLTGLTGLDEITTIPCIRVPYRKLASQALNSDKAALQFIYGTASAVSGATLWAVTFNANTGAILAQIDITPIISATTYAVFSPNGLETYGGNTQRIRAFVQPNGGGAVRLIQTVNGGSVWTSVNTGFDGETVFHLPPNLGGNGSKVIVSGADGIADSTNGGAALTDRTGDYDTETGSTQATGVFAL